MLNLLLQGQGNKCTLWKHGKILWGRVGMEDGVEVINSIY